MSFAIVLTLCISGFMILITSGWVIGTYNLFHNGKQNIKTQWGNIKAEYQRRADLFYNLVEAVKSNAKFEKDTLTTVIQARAGNFGKTKQQEKKTMDMLDNFMSKLSLVVERYPKLTATEQYKNLMVEVRITEDRINVARTEYNGVVREYNMSVITFPNKILAEMFNFKEEGFYQSESQEWDKSPKINLNLK